MASWKPNGTFVRRSPLPPLVDCDSYYLSTSPVYEIDELGLRWLDRGLLVATAPGFGKKGTSCGRADTIENFAATAGAVNKVVSDATANSQGGCADDRSASAKGHDRKSWTVDAAGDSEGMRPA
jgi:hypothetical protein